MGRCCWKCVQFRCLCGLVRGDHSSLPPPCTAWGFVAGSGQLLDLLYCARISVARRPYPPQQGKYSRRCSYACTSVAMSFAVSLRFVLDSRRGLLFLSLF